MPKGKRRVRLATSQIAASSRASTPVQTTPPPTPPPAPTQDHVLFFIEQSKASISPSCLNLVETELKNVKEDVLNLVIHTYGGDVYTTLRIIRILQDKFKKIRVIIPDFAFSSGTMMTLGGDEVYMDKDAMLGPLDLPMEHPSDGSTISSLDITNTLSNLASICTSIGMQVYGKLREDAQDFKLGKSEASKIAFETATKIISPIVEKIDPYTLQRGYRETRIAYYYAIDLLSSRMMLGNISQALDTSRALVNNYPSHGYGIFRDEAKGALKLNVHNLEDMPEWQRIAPEFNKIKDSTRVIKYATI